MDGKWAIDLSDYDSLSLDVALPADAPPEVGVAVSLKVGDELDEIQMADPEILAVGELTSIELDLRPGATGWVRNDQPVVVDASTFANIRGIGIAWGVYAFDYTGKTTLYVDAIRLCCAEVDS